MGEGRGSALSLRPCCPSQLPDVCPDQRERRGPWGAPLHQSQAQARLRSSSWPPGRGWGPGRQCPAPWGEQVSTGHGRLPNTAETQGDLQPRGRGAHCLDEQGARGLLGKRCSASLPPFSGRAPVPCPPSHSRSEPTSSLPGCPGKPQRLRQVTGSSSASPMVPQALLEVPGWPCPGLEIVWHCPLSQAHSRG